MLLGFIQNLVPSRSSPIGVDLGTRTIRLAQVEVGANDELQMLHADAIDVPADANVSADLYRAFAVKAIANSLRNGKFKGRRVALSLSQATVQAKHVRIERRDENELPAQISEKASTAFDANPNELLVRHFIAGDIVGDSGAQQETVLFAARRGEIQALLADFERARIEVVGVHVQPRILVEAFSHYHRRKVDEDAVNLFVDLGGESTRAVVADPTTIRFVRAASPGVDAIHAAIAAKLALPIAEVAELRRLTIAAQLVRSHDLPVASAETMEVMRERLETATADECLRLADELDMCRRYHDATFPARPITRLIFCGGGARDRILCAAIAQQMSLPAQIGDPLVRFNRSLLPSLACLDRREPQPAWASAIGLSLFGQTVAVA